jgi:hypothetical protein
MVTLKQLQSLTTMIKIEDGSNIKNIPKHTFCLQQGTKVKLQNSW